MEMSAAWGSARGGPPRAPAGAVARPSLAVHAFAFVLPLTALVHVNIGGTLFGQDGLGLALLVALGLRAHSLRKLREVRIFFVLAGIWLLSQILTDLVRQSDPEDYIRGWSKILFFMIQFAALWLFLTRSFSLFTAYMLGYGVSAILATRQLPEGYYENPWKFGLGIGVLTIAAVMSGPVSRRLGNSPLVAPAMMLVAAGLALTHNARSLFGMAVLSAAYAYLSSVIARRPALARSIRPYHFALFMLVGVLLAQGLVSGYGSLVSTGALGDEARAKYEMQSSGDLSILQGGRVESLVSTVAIADSPILGHGSWARDIYYVRLLTQKLRAAGIPQPPGEGDSDLIPAHSHLLGAWVEAGIAGAVFWTWALVICFVALFQLLKLPGAPNPIIVLAAFTMLWDIPFSPFGADVRFVRAAQIALLLYAIRQARAFQTTTALTRRRA